MRLSIYMNRVLSIEKYKPQRLIIIVFFGNVLFTWYDFMC